MLLKNGSGIFSARGLKRPNDLRALAKSVFRRNDFADVQADVPSVSSRKSIN
jgi:hypothetical protein